MRRRRESGRVRERTGRGNSSNPRQGRTHLSLSPIRRTSTTAKGHGHGDGHDHDHRFLRLTVLTVHQSRFSWRLRRTAAPPRPCAVHQATDLSGPRTASRNLLGRSTRRGYRFCRLALASDAWSAADRNKMQLRSQALWPSGIHRTVLAATDFTTLAAQTASASRSRKRHGSRDSPPARSAANGTRW